MDAFPRRTRTDFSSQASAAVPVLSPLQVQDLFVARLDDICAQFEDWGFPLMVVGQLGEITPNTYRKYYQVPLIDRQAGMAIGLDVTKSVLAEAGVGPGDNVRVTGFLRARAMRGQASLRFEVLAVEGHDPARQMVDRVERSQLQVLRDLSWQFQSYPAHREARLLLIHSASSSALVSEDFLQALGGAWRPERVRRMGVSMADPQRLAEAIGTCREDILVLIRGGGEASDFMVFENVVVLEALAKCQAHRVLGLGHSANRTLAELVVDHAATTPADAGHYIRRMSGRVWQEQEERRAEEEEMAALRESAASLASVPAGVPFWARVRNGMIVLGIGLVLGAVLARFL